MFLCSISQIFGLNPKYFRIGNFWFGFRKFLGCFPDQDQFIGMKWGHFWSTTYILITYLNCNTNFTSEKLKKTHNTFIYKSKHYNLLKFLSALCWAWYNFQKGMVTFSWLFLIFLIIEDLIDDCNAPSTLVFHNLQCSSLL